ncbi:hypothetical protein GAY29_19500 [Azospirillum brasilense]|uniref:hypothetical protein n=1 Tax=Azospirillum brasilense TaxID=192 RepID=UPI001909C4BE|nr:hypothetical protein [Azospirillum brasilense]MBK3735252.1 hypothetical protein [Azospirillum brasilense]
MAVTFITVPYYRTFRDAAVRPGSHTLCRIEHDALSGAHQLLLPRGQAWCHMLGAPADQPGGMTDTPRILHRFGWCRDMPPVRAVG